MVDIPLQFKSLDPNVTNPNQITNYIYPILDMEEDFERISSDYDESLTSDTLFTIKINVNLIDRLYFVLAEPSDDTFRYVLIARMNYINLKDDENVKEIFRDIKTYLLYISLQATEPLAEEGEEEFDEARAVEESHGLLFATLYPDKFIEYFQYDESLQRDIKQSIDNEDPPLILENGVAGI